MSFKIATYAKSSRLARWAWLTLFAIGLLYVMNSVRYVPSQTPIESFTDRTKTWPSSVSLDRKPTSDPVPTTVAKPAAEPNREADSELEVVLEDSQSQTRIPQKIWQIFFSDHIKPKHMSLISDWLVQSSGYTYTMVGDVGGEAFVSKHFGKKHLDVFTGLENVALKSDFLRYMILAKEGGFYGDTDTKPLVPLDDWVPEEFKSKARLIVGPEFDRQIYAYMSDVIPYDLQFGQWCIAGAAGHPVFKRMVELSLERITELSKIRNETLETLRPTDGQVLNATGPWAWTEVVWAYILEQNDTSVQKWEDLSRLTEPRMVGDVLVLPLMALRAPNVYGEINFFTEHPWRRLVDHAIWGTWREDHVEEEDDQAEGEVKAESKAEPQAEPQTDPKTKAKEQLIEEPTAEFTDEALEEIID